MAPVACHAIHLPELKNIKINLTYKGVPENMNSSANTAEISARYYPLWKVVLTTLGIAIFLTSAGQIIGHRFFWSGYDMRRIDREIKHYRQLVEAEPANPEYRVALGFAYFRRGQLDLAIRQYEAAIEVDKDFMPANLSMGYAYYQIGLYNEALASFVRATELGPDDYRGHLNMGICYYELKMYEDAKKSLYKAKMLNPSAAEVMFHLGVVYERENIPSAAIERYQEALALDPRFTEASQALERMTIQ
jgi:tetratricopeptide (TPR) repeat protein